MIRRFDIFVGFNLVLLVATTTYAFFTASAEFGMYAVVMFGIGLLIWKVMRKYDYAVWMLLLLQVGIFAHFAGGFTFVDGVSLYWYEGLGIRFDRIVHFYNSAIGAVVMLSVYRQAGLTLGTWEPWVVIMTVFGLGAIIEIIEFAAVTVVPNTGVGDHANTIEDMIVNLVGAAVGYLVGRAVLRGRATLSASAKA